MTDMRTGERLPAFSVQLDPPPEGNEHLAARLARLSAKLYGRDVLDVELYLQTALERIRGPRRPTDADTRMGPPNRPNQLRLIQAHLGPAPSSSALTFRLEELPRLHRQEPESDGSWTLRLCSAALAGVLSARADGRRGRAPQTATHPVRRSAASSPAHRGARPIRIAKAGATGRRARRSAVDTHGGRACIPAEAGPGAVTTLERRTGCPAPQQSSTRSSRRAADHPKIVQMGSAKMRSARTNGVGPVCSTAPTRSRLVRLAGSASGHRFSASGIAEPDVGAWSELGHVEPNSHASACTD